MPVRVADELAVVRRIAPIGPALRARRIPIAVKKAILVRLHAPGVLALRTNKVAHGATLADG